MKKLESLKKYKMSDTNIEIIGGARYTGSFTCGGTTYSYDGDMTATALTSGAGVDIAGYGGQYTTTNVANDFTGCISTDGHGVCSTWVGINPRF